MGNDREIQVSNFSLELSEQEAPVREVPALPPVPHFPSLAVSLLINRVGQGTETEDNNQHRWGHRPIFNNVHCIHPNWQRNTDLIGMAGREPLGSFFHSFLVLPALPFMLGVNLTWWGWRRAVGKKEKT